MKEFLILVSSSGISVAGNYMPFAGNKRNFDIFHNDFTGRGIHPADIKYTCAFDDWKFRLARKFAPVIQKYAAVALLDDDVELDWMQINNLFEVGCSLGLDIWQAALSADSYSSYKHHYARPRSYVRRTNTVELMMPFMSCSAFERVVDTFDVTDSGWGIEVEWANRLKNLAIVDAIEAKHMRPHRQNRKMPSGLYPHEEANIVAEKYNLDLQREIW